MAVIVPSFPLTFMGNGVWLAEWNSSVAGGGLAPGDTTEPLNLLGLNYDRMTVQYLAIGGTPGAGLSMRAQVGRLASGFGSVTGTGISMTASGFQALNATYAFSSIDFLVSAGDSTSRVGVAVRFHARAGNFAPIA